MANNCFNDYTFRGKVEALQKLHEAFKSLCWGARLGDIYEKLGGTEEIYDNKATLEWFGEVDKLDSSLNAHVHSAGCTPFDIVSAICELLDIRANWYSEEPSDDLYEKHDEDDDYITFVYFVEDRENDVHDSFGSLNDIITCNFSNELTEEEIASIETTEDLEEIINSKREECGEEGIIIHEVDEI